MVKKILFVCNANVGRSQIAEAMFNKMFADSEYAAESAGVSDIRAGKSVREALQTNGWDSMLDGLKKRGLDIGDCRCKPVTQDAVRDSSAVFAVDEKVRDKLISMFPESRAKIFILREFAHLKDAEIPDADPEHPPTTEYVILVYNKVHEALEKIKRENLLKFLS